MSKIIKNSAFSFFLMTSFCVTKACDRNCPVASKDESVQDSDSFYKSMWRYLSDSKREIEYHKRLKLGAINQCNIDDMGNGIDEKAKQEKIECLKNLKEVELKLSLKRRAESSVMGMFIERIRHGYRINRIESVAEEVEKLSN